MTEIIRVSRREFLRQTGIGTGALVLGCHVSMGGPAFARGGAATFQLNHFVAIQSDGTVILVAHRSEMGQGIRSSLPAVLADELEADRNRVKLRQADADAFAFAVPNPVQQLCPGTGEDLVHGEEGQFTDSSRSMGAYFQPMRLAGTAARLMLIRAAAQKLGVDAGECTASQHRVLHGPSQRSFDYGELVETAAKLAPPTLPEIQAALKQPEEWRLIGTKNMPFYDAEDMVTGKAVYGADFRMRGMLTAMIEHCPVANGTVKSFDASEAMKVPGVRKVLATPFQGGVGAAFLPHAGVAVVAENTWAAWKGRRALKIEWEPGPFADPKFDSKNFRALLEQSTANPGKKVRSRGDVDAAFAPPHKVVEASYYVPYLAQTPMEPPAAVALFKDGRWEIWTPTQGPQITQQYVGLAMLHPDPRELPLWLAWPEPEHLTPDQCGYEEQRDFQAVLQQVLGVDAAGLQQLREKLKKEVREKVQVHVTLLGGGFGRKSKPDWAIEAAYLAAQFPGEPVRVQWTREDDIKFSYYNAVAHQYLKAALDAEGKAKAWLQRSAYPSFFATIFPPPLPPVPEPVRPLVAKARAAFHHGGEFPYSSAIERAHGLEDMPFDVPNIRIENCQAPSHIRGGWMRSVANIYHAFAIGSFADELANAAGRDSKDYLLELIGSGGILDLRAEGVECFDNNQFPQDGCFIQPDPSLPPKLLLPGYPADTRRLRTVVEKVAKAADWDRRKAGLPPGRGLGIAAHRSFLTYVALVIDASLNEFNELTIHEIWGAIDCGLPVNPDRILAQMEGGIVYGLTLALHGEITVKNGAVEQNNFDDYPMLRLYQTPKINDAVLVREWPDHPLYRPVAPPSGVGEPPVPPVAPALCNAIVAAGGPRIRELPLYKFVEVL